MSSTAGEYAMLKQEAYEGASDHYRLEQRGLVTGDQDTLAAKELANLWARSHHAIRNNGVAATAKLKYRSNLGSIKVVWKNENGKVNKKMQAWWETFAADPNLDGFGNFVNTQDLWNGSMFESGESITRMVIKKRKGHTIPLALQVIESEFLNPNYDAGMPETTRQGITFKDSRPLTYHFLKTLKGNFGDFSYGHIDSSEYVKVPADEIIHQLDRERPNQWRGVPKLASILLPLYELDDLTDATVNKQKAAQAVAWIVKNTNPVAALTVGTVRSTTDASDVDENGNARKISQSGSSNVQYLNKNEDLIPVQGTDIGNNLDTLIKSELHKIAQACGLSYEVLTGDLSGISFSSLKFVINEMKKSADFVYTNRTISLGLIPLCNRFKELAEIYGSKNASAANPTFEYPKRYGIDELKDTQADLLKVSSGMGTLGNVLTKNSLTFDDIKEDKAKMKEAGIDLAPDAQSKNVKPNAKSAEV